MANIRIGTCMLLLLLFGYCCTVSALPNKHGSLLPDAVARRAKQRSAREAAAFNKLRATPTHKHNPAVKTATNPKDKQALEDFYRSTKGAQWANNSNWMKGDPCSDGWYGIYCSTSGRVLELGLVYNLVSGAIPSSISDLTSLQSLLLYSNNIGGSLPESLFKMSSLQTLDVDNNEISGSLPSSISMSQLQTLNLYGNRIRGQIPTEWDTPNLQTLSISSNMLTGSLPASIGQLTKLTSLVLSRNMLTGSLQPEYGNLKNLQMLWLFDNQFDKPAIPESWSKLTNLVNVELDGLSGEFPSWLGTSWNKLENLVIVNGYLTGPFPTSLCSLKKVQYLHIFNNSLTGVIPDCVCELPKSLNSLEMSDNTFSGSIPSCIGKLSATNLTELYLSRNNLSGWLPTSLGDFRHLQVIDVSSNSISGPIPASFRGLTNGTYGLFLCYNRLSTFQNPNLDVFFKFIQDYTCALYNNPWSCPIPDYVPKGCDATCSECNTGTKRGSCHACDGNLRCGWCTAGSNCLEGTRDSPQDPDLCERKNWYQGLSNCPK